MWWQNNTIRSSDKQILRMLFAICTIDTLWLNYYRLYCTWFQFLSKQFIYLVVMSYVAGMLLFTALTAISWKMCEREGNKKWYNQKLEPSRTNSRQLWMLSCVLSFTSEVHVCPRWKWPYWMWNCCKDKDFELERQKPEPVLNGFCDPLFKLWVLESGVNFSFSYFSFCILCFKLGFPRSLVTQIGCGISAKLLRLCRHTDFSDLGVKKIWGKSFRAACHVDISMAVSGWRKGWLKATLVTVCFVAQLSISKLFHQEEK